MDIDNDSFIVILTREHRYDRTVLAQALRTGAGYIGMISSRRKREIIYNELKEEGVSSEALDRVHSPVGLSIGAETPEEIAVSIVAELIAERSRQY
jgi:xanthine dehydrogenase accessory factor